MIISNYSKLLINRSYNKRHHTHHSILNQRLDILYLRLSLRLLCLPGTSKSYISSRAKKVYVGGLCTYSCGMMLLSLLRARAAVILFSWTAGVMYSTLFTMPYLLVAHYHATGMVITPCFLITWYNHA